MTSWGVPIKADATKNIGSCIRSTGIYDIAVSEVLARIITPGDTVIDAGANIGYMTVLAAVATGKSGRVISFEPHPELFKVLRSNADSAGARTSTADTELHNSALGAIPGTAQLVLPDYFSNNDGVAYIGNDTDPAGNSVTVRIETIDDVLGEATAKVMKLDVEGFEEQVLKGATRALKDKRIQHIVFEDHKIECSAVLTLLREMGYSVFALGWTIRGIEIQPVEMGPLAEQYEAPNYIATTDSNDLRSICSQKGWLVLSHKLLNR